MPDFIKYDKKQWDDLELNPSDLTIYVDGSIRYLLKDKRSHIYGHGGSGFIVFYKGKIIKEQIIPYSTRTTIDKCEFRVIVNVFIYIIN